MTDAYALDRAIADARATFETVTTDATDQLALITRVAQVPEVLAVFRGLDIGVLDLEGSLVTHLRENWLNTVGDLMDREADLAELLERDQEGDEEDLIEVVRSVAFLGIKLTVSHDPVED